MVKGLLEGLGEKFQMKITVEQQAPAETTHNDTFHISLLEEHP